MRKLKHVKRFFEAVEDDFETMPQAQEEIQDIEDVQGDDQDDDKITACIGQAQECIAKIEECIAQKEEEDTEDICCCVECKAVLELFVTVCDHKEHTQILDDVIALVLKTIPTCKEACGDVCEECLTSLEACLGEL